jgi:LCP family protein required for cell wall assembly
VTAPATARRRTWPQRLLISFNLTVIVGALVCAAGLGYFNLKLSKLKRVSVSEVLTGSSGGASGPQNYLLVGTDSDSGLGSNDPAVQGRGQVTGARSDTMMLLHVDPSSSKAMLLSVPRDLWVTISGTRTKSKINAAIEIGGPKLAISTVENALNVPINHYVEINFAGFKDLVAAVGGIPIYFNVPVRDAEFCVRGEAGCVGGIIRHSILDVETPGCRTLNPDEALAYARSRYFQYQVNGRWKADENGDLGRISRQQDFMRTALKRALSKAIHNPLSLNSLIDSGLKAVTVDDKLSPGDVFALARKFRSFNPDTLQTIELPVVGRGDGANVLVNQTAAAPILAPFRGQTSAVDGGSSLEPKSVKVQVLNGSGKAGQASTISRAFASAGFTTVTPGDAIGRGGAATVVRYASGDEAAAQLVARYIDGPVTYETSSQVAVGNVVVVTSSSLNGVRTSAGDAPAPSTTSTTTTVVPAPTQGTSGASGASGTPTTAGFVPNRPPAGVSCS